MYFSPKKFNLMSQKSKIRGKTETYKFCKDFTGVFQILCWIREAPWPVTFPLKNEKNFAKMTHHHLIISAMTYVKWGKFLYKNIFFLWNDSSFNLHILRQDLKIKFWYCLPKKLLRKISIWGIAPFALKAKSLFFRI